METLRALLQYNCQG